MGIGAKMIRGWLVLNSLIDFFPLCISPNFLGAGPAFDMLATDIYLRVRWATSSSCAPSCAALAA